MSGQDTKTPSSRGGSATDMTVPKETAEGDSTPVAKKRQSKFIAPTEKPPNPPDMTKTPPAVKRTPPPRPSTQATSQDKLNKRTDDASDKPSPPADQTVPEAQPRRPPPVKRPPPPKLKETDPESKSIPNQPIKRPPVPKARSIDREVEHSEKETTDSEISEPPVKPVGRPTRPPAVASRPKSVIMSEDKPNARSQDDIEPPSQITAADELTIQKEEATNNEPTQNSVKSPEKPASRPSRPPTIKKPPRPKSVIMSEDKGDTNTHFQDDIQPPSKTPLPSIDAPIVQKEEVVNSVKSPEKPASRPSRPPTIKKPPRPKSVVISENRGDTNTHSQENIEPPNKTPLPATDEPIVQKEEIVKPAGRPTRPPAVASRPKSVIISEDKGDTNAFSQEDIQPPSKTPLPATDAPIVEKEEATINDTTQNSVKSPEKPASRPSRPPTMKKPPRPKSVVMSEDKEDTNTHSQEDIQPPSKTPLRSTDEPTIQKEEAKTTQDSVKSPERPASRPSRPPTMKKQPRPESIVTSEATELESNPLSQESMNNVKYPEQTPNRPSKPPTVRRPSLPDIQPSDEAKKESDAQENVVKPLETPREQVEQAIVLQPREDKGAKAEKTSPKNVKRSPSVSRPPPPRVRTGSTAKRDGTDSSIDQPTRLKKSPSISRPPPPRGRIGSTIKKDKPSDEPTKLKKSPSISRPPPPRGRIGSTIKKDKPSDEPTKLKKSPSMSRPPPPKSKVVSTSAAEGEDKTVKLPPKKRPSMKRPPPPKQKVIETIIPEKPQLNDVSIEDNVSSVHVEKKSPPKRPPTISRPPPPSKSSTTPSEENTQPSEVLIPSEENTQPTEVSTPSEESTQATEVSIPSKQEEVSQEDTEVAMKMSTTHKRPSITIPPPPKKPQVKEIQLPSQKPPEDNTSFQEGSRKSPPLTRPPPPSTSSVELKNSPPQRPKATPDTKQSSKAEGLTNKKELTANNAQHTEEPPSQQIETHDDAALPEQSVTEDISEIEVTQPVEPIAEDSELTNSEGPSGEAAVLEVQSVDQGEDAIEEPDEKRLPKESKSTSALMKPSGLRPEEEEGSIRIIRYDKKESSFDGG